MWAACQGRQGTWLPDPTLKAANCAGTVGKRNGSRDWFQPTGNENVSAAEAASTAVAWLRPTGQTCDFSRFKGSKHWHRSALSCHRFLLLLGAPSVCPSWAALRQAIRPNRRSAPWTGRGPKARCPRRRRPTPFSSECPRLWDSRRAARPRQLPGYFSGRGAVLESRCFVDALYSPVLCTKYGVFVLGTPTSASMHHWRACWILYRVHSTMRPRLHLRSSCVDLPLVRCQGGGSAGSGSRSCIQTEVLVVHSTVCGGRLPPFQSQECECLSSWAYSEKVTSRFVSKSKFAAMAGLVGGRGPGGTSRHAPGDWTPQQLCHLQLS
jgi:hypothetical protein